MSNKIGSKFDYRLLVCYLSVFASLLTGATANGHVIALGFESVLALLVCAIVLCCMFLVVCTSDVSWMKQHWISSTIWLVIQVLVASALI